MTGLFYHNKVGLPTRLPATWPPRHRGNTRIAGHWQCKSSKSSKAKCRYLLFILGTVSRNIQIMSMSIFPPNCLCIDFLTIYGYGDHFYDYGCRYFYRGVFCNMYCTAANVHYSYQVWSKHAVTVEIKMCISLRAVVCMFPALARTSAVGDPSVSQQVFTITEKAPTRAFSWLKAPTSAFTFKTLF